MARFIIFLDGLPTEVERRDVIKTAATEDCHSTRGYTVVRSPLAADDLAQRVLEAATQRGAFAHQVRITVIRIEEVATRGSRTAIEDCF